MENREKKTVWILLAAAIILSLISLMIGPASSGNIFSMENRPILLHLRLPRVLGAWICGGALALSGAIIQTVLNNPLSSANILGINSACGFFSVLAGIFFPASFLAGSLFSFVGGMIAALFIVLMVHYKKPSRLTIILAGLAIGSLFSAGIDLLLVIDPDALAGYASFKIGSLSGLSLRRVFQSALILVPLMIGVILLSRQLDMFSLGSLHSNALGFSFGRWMIAFLIVASALASQVVSLCGLIGFVGLIVPAWLSRFHLSMRGYLILSLMAGAVLVLVADLIGRVCFLPWEMPAGLILSLFGGPYFLVLLFTKGKNYA